MIRRPLKKLPGHSRVLTTVAHRPSTSERLQGGEAFVWAAECRARLDQYFLEHGEESVATIDGSSARMRVCNVMQTCNVLGMPRQTFLYRMRTGFIPRPAFQVLGRQWAVGFHYEEIILMIATFGRFLSHNTKITANSVFIVSTLEKGFSEIRKKYGVE